jgi:hypothetical protein
LEVGEKYLSIVLLGNIRVCAFKNKDKTNPTQPDFKGEGVAIWIQKKKAHSAKEENEDVEEEFI